MPMYYFDLQDGDDLVPDKDGVELRNLVAAQEEAARALAGLSWDAVRSFKGAQSQELSIEVRDDEGPLMKVRFSVEIVRNRFERTR